MKKRIKTILCAMLLGACPLESLAQYPTIPDSVKQRGKAMEAVWDSLDNAAWQKALPIVMDGMLHGKRFVPW